MPGDNMEKEIVEIGGELASVLNEAAMEKGVTFQEFVIHLLLKFVEEMDDEDDLDDDESGSSESDVDADENE